MLKIGELIEYQVYRGEALPVAPPPPAYRYFLAGNGVFVQAQNRFMRVLQPAKRLRVNGLPDLQPTVELKHKRLPGWGLCQLIAHGRKYPDREVFYQIVWGEDSRFHPKVVAVGEAASVIADVRTPEDNILIDIHTHHTMRACFSTTDNADEQHFRWYAVIGRIDQEEVEIAFRLGVYGHHRQLPVATLFIKDSAPAQRWREVSNERN